MESLGWEVIGPGPVNNWLTPFVRRQHVEPDPDDQVSGRHTGEIDACEMAGFAVTTVGADKVFRRQIVGTVWAGDMDRDAAVVLVETGQGMTPTNVGLLFAGPFGEHLNEAALLNRDDEQLAAWDRREVQWKAGEY